MISQTEKTIIVLSDDKKPVFEIGINYDKNTVTISDRKYDTHDNGHIEFSLEELGILSGHLNSILREYQ